MKTAIFFAAVYGAAISLALLRVGAPFRWVMSRLDYWIFRNKERSHLKMMAGCPSCLGFWLSLGATFWYAPLGPFIFDRLAVAFASVGIIWIVHVTLTKLGQFDL